MCNEDAGAPGAPKFGGLAGIDPREVICPEGLQALFRDSRPKARSLMRRIASVLRISRVAALMGRRREPKIE